MEEDLGAVTMGWEAVVRAVGGGGWQKQLKCLTRFSRLCCGKDAGPVVVAGRLHTWCPTSPRTTNSTLYM